METSADMGRDIKNCIAPKSAVQMPESHRDHRAPRSLPSNERFSGISAQAGRNANIVERGREPGKLHSRALAIEVRCIVALGLRSHVEGNLAVGYEKIRLVLRLYVNVIQCNVINTIDMSYIKKRSFDFFEMQRPLFIGSAMVLR